MGSIGNCCCGPSPCDSACVGVLDDEFDVSISFDGTHSIHMRRFRELPECPFWYGGTCWSANSTFHSSCTVEGESTPTCIAPACPICPRNNSGGTEPVWPGRPATSDVTGGTHYKWSVARWDKTRYSADMQIIPLGGTIYKVLLQITYKHAIRYTFSSCIQYWWQMRYYGPCDDFVVGSSYNYNSSSCTLGARNGYGPLTLPAHPDPFENDVELVCNGIFGNFPRSSAVGQPCPDYNPVVVNVSYTRADCVCCDYEGHGNWVITTGTFPVYPGEWCFADLLSIYCVPTGGTGGGPNCDEGYIVQMLIEYQSASIECVDLCGTSIELTRKVVTGEADPPVDVAASTLTRDPCDLGYGCVINQDRPLIAKPAKVYVTLPCAA